MAIVECVYILCHPRKGKTRASSTEACFRLVDLREALGGRACWDRQRQLQMQKTHRVPSCQGNGHFRRKAGKYQFPQEDLPLRLLIFSDALKK
jgi:hypothetical protein